MKNIFILSIVISVIAFSCTNEHGHSHAHDEHDHAIEAEALAYTVWTKKTELFVEFKPLIVGQTSTFAAHFSDMKGFKSINQGSVTVSLIKNGKGIRHTVDAPSSPGIFRPALHPKEKGVYQLVFDIQTDELSDKIVLDSVFVYENINRAISANPSEPEGNEISFLKEQAWKIDFAIEQIKQEPIQQVIKTSGVIETMPGDESIIIAKTSGIVLFNTGSTFIGNEVVSKEQLFTISGKGMTDNNIESRFAISETEFEKASTDYERGKKLVREKIISQKAFDELKSIFDIAKTKHNTIVANYGNGGHQIKAPFVGYIKDILVNEGQFVQNGEPLAILAKNKKLMLRADVSQNYFKDLALVNSANFKTSYDPSVYSIEEFNGKLMSYGKNVSSQSNYIPVYFEIDNKEELLPGSYLDVFLKTKSIENALVVSKSAIMEDYENYYVYVQTAGESFEKRDVTIGVKDGKRVQLLSGVNEGEWIVTKGAYQIKVASMSSTIPAHGHSH